MTNFPNVDKIEDFESYTTGMCRAYHNAQLLVEKCMHDHGRFEGDTVIIKASAYRELINALQQRSYAREPRDDNAA